MPRPPKYDWDDKRAICEKLYVEQNSTGPQIVDHFSKHFGIDKADLPKPSQFFRQFKRWGFTPRRAAMAAEVEAKLVARTKELFKGNLQAGKIQDVLNDEGWDMDDYHFRKLRRQHGLIMRNLVGYKPLPPDGKSKLGKRKRGSEEGEGGGGDRSGSGSESEDDDETAEAEAEAETPNGDTSQQAASLPPEEAARRAQRLADLQLQSDHLLQTRKRRRRIRGYGHLPPDAPGMEPRYGSETSLDECKAFLHLSNAVYAAMRTQYESVCRDMGIIKMSLCVPGQWQESKDRLIRENAHLSAVLHPLQQDLEKKALALNVICMDVTKRMRTMSKALTIADANNILGLDPLQSKEIRRILYDILEADQFTTVVACGKEHVDELREKWYSQSDILKQVVSECDPRKLRAVDLLSKDARKRYCDDSIRKDPGRRQWQKQKLYGPGPGPAKGAVRIFRGPVATSSMPVNTNGEAAAQPAPSETPGAKKRRERRRNIVPVGGAWTGHEVPEWRTTGIADVLPPINFSDHATNSTNGITAQQQSPANQARTTRPPVDHVGLAWMGRSAPQNASEDNVTLDPLLYPSNGPPWPPISGEESPWPEYSGPGRVNPTSFASTANPTTTTSTSSVAGGPSTSVPIPAYFRLALNSTLIGYHPRMWLGKLSAPTVGALRVVATAKAGAARVAKVQGVVKNGDGNGEDCWLIESDEELAVYLEEAGEKATFVVVLEGGYA